MRRAFSFLISDTSSPSLERSDHAQAPNTAGLVPLDDMPGTAVPGRVHRLRRELSTRRTGCLHRAGYALLSEAAGPVGRARPGCPRVRDTRLLLAPAQLVDGADPPLRRPVGHRTDPRHR